MRFPRARKLLKRLKLLGIAAAVCLFVAAAIVFAIHCSTVRGNFQPSKPTQTGNGIANYARPEDDTFLTYAEWYIVWSYQEKAAWQQAHLPSSFPYFQAIGQYWSGYCCSYGVVRGRYPFNFGDHLMLVVIGTSFTVEYALKGAYEDTVGRLSEPGSAATTPLTKTTTPPKSLRATGSFSCRTVPFTSSPSSPLCTDSGRTRLFGECIRLASGNAKPGSR